MSTIDYSERIPNNVDLAGDKALQRALEQWQPDYLDWWREMGPEGSQALDVYLRTAVSVEPSGWAQFRLREDARLPLGHLPRAARRRRATCTSASTWASRRGRTCPGEHRANLRRIIVTQGDTEPASVEQQRHLGLTCPSLYDLRNLFQVNVEEGRHLWAMVYLLHRYFGRDGREEAEALLQRRSGDTDNPRILGAFNERTPDWLAFFMFTYFTDRDGKFQLCALAESAFDPLARTTHFMLTEEAHHMFVGESGVARMLQRTAEVMRERCDRRSAGGARGRRDRPADAAALPQFPLQRDDRPVRRRPVVERGDVLQRGAQGPLRGRQARRRPPAEGARPTGSSRTPTAQLVERDVPMLNALNEVLRDDFIRDSVGRHRALEQGAGEERRRRSASSCRTRRSTARSARSPACA